MRKTFIPMLLFLVIHAFGQEPVTKLDESLTAGTRVRVEYIDQQKQGLGYACFINGIFANQTLLKTLDPDLVDSLYVVEDNIQIGNIQYYSQIYIKTKSSYKPKLISLADLKSKYTGLKDKTTLFILDGNVLNGDYNTYLIDENYLMTIIIDKVKNPENNLDLNVIKLVLGTRKNQQKVKDLRIRGAEMSLN